MYVGRIAPTYVMGKETESAVQKPYTLCYSMYCSTLLTTTTTYTLQSILSISR